MCGLPKTLRICEHQDFWIPRVASLSILHSPIQQTVESILLGILLKDRKCVCKNRLSFGSLDPIAPHLILDVDILMNFADTLCNKQWFSASFSPNITISIPVTEVETTSASSIQYWFSERLSSLSSSSGFVVHDRMCLTYRIARLMPYVPFTCSGCLQLQHDSSITSLDSIQGATASLSGSPSVRLRKHCRTFLHADNVFPLTITSSRGSSAEIIWKTSFKQLPLLTWLKLQIVWYFGLLKVWPYLCS